MASQGGVDESDSEIVSALRALVDVVASDVSALDAETLIAGAQHAEHVRDGAPNIAGRLLAELHDRGYSWPEISRLTGISQSTAFRRADPFLPPGEA